MVALRRIPGRGAPVAAPKSSDLEPPHMHDARFRTVMAHRVEGLAPAKLNLFLEVLGRRDDGYHELRTVFHEIDFADAMAVELAPGAPADAIALTGLPIDGAPATNLALRAVAAFRRRFPRCPPVRVELEKLVPPGSGTGGGSADAAFVLAALQQLCGAPLDDAALRATARELGADVGFFLNGGTAIGSGRGDELVAVEFATTLFFVLAVPSFSLSTATVYAHVDLNGPRADVSSFVAALQKGEGETSIARPFNRLEAAAIRADPRVSTSLARLRAATGTAWFLTGSGSGMFAPAADASAATRIAEGVTRGGGPDLRIVRIIHSFARHRGREWR